MTETEHIFRTVVIAVVFLAAAYAWGWGPEHVRQRAQGVALAMGAALFDALRVAVGLFAVLLVLAGCGASSSDHAFTAVVAACDTAEQRVEGAERACLEAACDRVLAEIDPEAAGELDAAE